MASWHTLDSARTQWVDAPIDDEQLTELLEVAKDAVLAYAPAIDTAAPEPWTETSAGPDVATLTVTPIGGLASFTLEVPGTGPWSDTVQFALPDAYTAANPSSWTATDETLDAYLQLGTLDSFAAYAAAGAAGRTLTGAWVPATPFGDVPVAYRSAQLMQARNIWNSAQASPSGDFDGGGYGLTTFPLDWQVKQLLRPRSVFGGPVG